MSQQQKKVHLLPFLHLISMIALAAWWGVFFWSHTPSRDLFRLSTPSHRQVARAHQHWSLFPQVASLNEAQSSRFIIAARMAVGDLACGISVLFLVGLASGVYIRRLDTWLNARTSGQAVAFRGQDLTTATLDANAKQQRGIIR